MATKMGLGNLGLSNIRFGHKKWYWIIEITGKYNLKHTFKDRIKFQRIKDMDIEETEINFLSDKKWIPNKDKELKEYDGTIFAPLSLGRKIDLMELAAAQQPIECKIVLYDGCDNAIEEWVFNNAIMHQAKEECDPCSDPALLIRWKAESYTYKSLIPTYNV
jgi:hypothetical protein